MGNGTLKMNNIFAGTYLEVLEMSDKLVGIDKIIVEDKPSSQSVIDYANLNKIDCVIIDKQTLVDDKLITTNIGLVLVASFGRTLKNSFIQCAQCVVNFHPGIIQFCRGRHPLPVAILQRHKMMGMTCHVIDSEEIDAGPIVAQIQLPINYNQNYWYNEKRLRSTLYGLTEIVLSEYVNKNEVSMTDWFVEDKYYMKPLSSHELEKVFSAQQLASLFDGELP